MKRRLLLTIVLSLAVGVTACGDDPAENNGNTGNNGIADGGDAGTDAEDGGGGEDADGGGGDEDADGGGGGDTDDGGNDADDGGDPTGLIVAEDQLLAASSSQTVTIASATSEGAGWAVIHEGDGSGNVGEIIGQTVLTDGENTDVTVDVNRNLTHGETLYAMLHIDVGTAGSFDATEDIPVTDDSDVNITDTFVVSVPTVVPYDPATIDDLSTVVTLNTVVAEEDAWVVIHEGPCADGGAVIGHTAVTSGENSDVEVVLDRPAVDAETLCGMLHFDTGEAGTYEFGDVADADGPVQLADDSVVMDDFEVDLAEGTPAIRITLGASGSQNYEFQSFEPASLDHDGLAGTDDPELFLNEGWRYEIVNTVATAHPFEFVADETGVSGQGDLVVLSQATDPEEENDAATNWVEDGDTIRFTVAGEAFEGRSTSVTSSHTGAEKYWCQMHPTSMTGGVTVQTP